MTATTADLMQETTPASITVYTKPSCVQCNATYRALDEASAVACLATSDGAIRP